MERIVTDTAKLAATEISFREQIAVAREILKSLEDDMAALNAMWDGPAKESFNQELNDSIQMLWECLEELEGVANYEENARDGYQKCGADIADFIEGVSLDV